MIAKKNLTIKAAVLMLVLVLITSCFVGGTFAKYVTSGSGSDTARVAKFGVTVTANGTMFAKKYATDDASVVGTIAESVISSNDKNLVAPGTKGDMASMTLTGTPEVAVKVTYNAAGKVSLTDWALEDGKFYCPLVFKIKNADGTKDTIYGAEYNDAATLEGAIVTAINSYSKEYAAGTDLTQKGDDSLTVSWEWPFETAVNPKDLTQGYRDADDTYLGNQAAKGNAATVSIGIVTTVTQID